MKTILTLFLGLVALAVPAQTMGLNAKISSAEPKRVQCKWVTLTSNTNVVASSTNLQFTAATFYGLKADGSGTNAPTANTASVYVGFRDETGTNISNAATITAGSYVQLVGTGTKYNLTEITFTGTTGDKVLVVYEQ